MAEIIIMPKLGFNMDEGKLVKWYKAEGESVKKGEPLFSVETDKTNTVLRSSLLAMPPVKLGASGGEDSGDDDDELIIPVSYVNLNSISSKLYEGDNPAVASVDQTGLVTALAAGTAKVTAASGGKSGTCSVTVSPLAEAIADYVDEYGVNHGKGVAIGMAIWAPVNCGYHKDDYKYGKLYQWGRKYGQGYSGYDSNTSEDVSDATVPTFAEGGVSEIGGNHKSNANVFYTGYSDWVDPRNDEMWNSGSESNPVKTEYDPCPDGWRVPTYAELSELSQNHSSWTSENGQSGYWFSGASSYTETVPQIFFPAAGYRDRNDGDAGGRGDNGNYWSSRPNDGHAYYLCFYSSYVNMHGYYDRASGYSVRCVQATDEVAEL